MRHKKKLASMTVHCYDMQVSLEMNSKVRVLVKVVLLGGPIALFETLY